ncbi:hypothetical protein Tco_0097180, partial [Tanacetum coccineum]
VVKNLNNPRQDTKDVLVGPKVSFKSTKQIYNPVSNKNAASTSGKKKQAEVFRQEVSNSNLVDALNSIENEDDLAMNGRGNSKLAGKESINVMHGSSSNTPIQDKDGDDMLLDENENDSIEPKSGEGRERLKEERVDERLLEKTNISIALTIDVQVILSRQRSEKERLEVRRNVESKRTIRSEMTIRSEKIIEKERNHLEVKRPFEVRKEVYEK